MTKSEQIRALARDLVPVAEIARRLGIRYQHAYNVLAAARQPSEGEGRAKPVAMKAKAALTVDRLLKSGFQHASLWTLSDGELCLDRPLPKAAGVYAMAKDGVALYVGVATVSLAKRVHFYTKPGLTQTTNQRLNRLIKTELEEDCQIELYVAVPPDMEWNGLPVSGPAGLEHGLIKAFALPWNERGTTQ